MRMVKAYDVPMIEEQRQVRARSDDNNIKQVDANNNGL